MRLIDADELIEHVWRDRLDSRERIANLVESMPTIEPQRTYTDAEIQKMQDLEQAQFDTMYQLGYEDGKKATQRMTGHWIKKMNVTESNGSTLYRPEWYCSHCRTKYDPYFAQKVNFCCVCGSDMRGEQE